MNSRDGITEEDDERLFGGLVQEGAKGNLGLVRQRLRLVKHNHLGGGIIWEKRLK